MRDPSVRARCRWGHPRCRDPTARLRSRGAALCSGPRQGSQHFFAVCRRRDVRGRPRALQDPLHGRAITGIGAVVGGVSLWFPVGVSLGARERFSDSSAVSCAMPYRKTRLIVQQGARAAREVGVTELGHVSDIRSAEAQLYIVRHARPSCPVLFPPSPSNPAHRFCQAHCLRDSIPSGRAGPLR